VNPSWTVEFTNARDKRTVKWNVSGSSSTKDVHVNVSLRIIARSRHVEEYTDH
jgi:hypothetical protein